MKLQKLEEIILSQKSLYIVNNNTISILEGDVYKSIQPYCLTKNKTIKTPSDVKIVLNVNVGYILKNGYKLSCYIVTTSTNEYLLMKQDDYQFVVEYDYKGILVYQ